MSESSTAILKRLGPSLTSDVISAMVAAGASPTAARQRVTRAQQDYTRLAGIRFTKNARFIYLPEQFGTHEYWAGLERAFYKAGKSYWNALVTLRSRGGVCPSYLFPTITSAPLLRKGQLSPDHLKERLSAIQLIKETDDETIGSYVEFVPHSFSKINTTKIQALLIAEHVALYGIREWARRLGFGSFGKFSIRGDEKPPIVAGMMWDLSAPSYFRPLLRVIEGKAKPGFIVCDINMNNVVSKDAVEAFVRKCDMASAPPSMPPIMPILVGQGFSEEGFSMAKQKGILAITTSALFGESISKALDDLIKLLSDTGATAAINPAHLEKVMNSLTTIEGAAHNIRGSLFEFVIGSLVKDVEDGYLKVSEKKLHISTGRHAEIDVYLDRGEEKGILIIECKSKLPNARVSIEEVKKWYSDRVPLIYDILSNDGSYKDKHYSFEIWSNGPFNDDAVEWLEAQKLKFPHYTLGWRDGVQLKVYADKASQSSLRQILK
ncbi:MAG: hypothetical protein ACK52W_05065, partial [Alphaproteobacteria bacterium]